MGTEDRATLTLDGEVTEDGRLLVSLPAGAPRGRVRVTLALPGDACELAEEDLQGLGLTAEEIAQSPEFGAWGQDGLAGESARLVAELRDGRSRYRW